MSADETFDKWYDGQESAYIWFEGGTRRTMDRAIFRAGWNAREIQLAALRKLCAEAAEWIARRKVVWRVPSEDHDLVNRLRAAAKEEA